MSYLKFICLALLPSIIIISCDTTSANEDNSELIEIISSEVDSIGANAIHIKTEFKLTREYDFDETNISYELYISNEDQPDESNSVSFTDITGKEGLLEYDSLKNQGTLINVIQDLDLETEYYYRIKIKINDHQKWSEVSSFRTKDVVEILSTEARSIKTRSVRLYTIFKINGTGNKNHSYGYKIYLSTDENPNDSNSVDFFDETFMTGLVYYDKEKGQGVSSNPILELLPSTDYYYRVKIIFGDHEQLSDIVSFTTKEESYEENGGIEFYDKGEYSDGWRYLVAAPPGWHDDSVGDPAAAWGCYNQKVGVKFEIGDGLENTEKIIESGCGNKYDKPIAAELAYQLDLNGYSDWFLPSGLELEKLISFYNETGLDGNSYWSSTDDSPIEAIFIDKWGWFGHGFKTNTIKVRPIRRY